MNPTEQIKALAELDGFENLYRYFSQPASIFGKMVDMGTQDGKGESVDLLGRELKPVPDYLTSFDCIIPLIQKQSPLAMTQFVDFLCKDLLGDHYDGSDYISQVEIGALFRATPAQLREALLRATGKWKE